MAFGAESPPTYEFFSFDFKHICFECASLVQAAMITPMKIFVYAGLITTTLMPNGYVRGHRLSPRHITFGTDPIKARQVRNPRIAAREWHKRHSDIYQEKARRAEPSSIIVEPSTGKAVVVVDGQPKIVLMTPTCETPLPLYAQCGGINSEKKEWIGCCMSGAHCKTISKEYSECTTGEPTSADTTVIISPAIISSGDMACTTHVNVNEQCAGVAGRVFWQACCVSGSSCVKINDDHSMCISNGESTTASTSSSSSVSSTSSASSSPSPACTLPVGVWGQCGGQTDGVFWLSCCVEGSYCLKSNDYYSQCVPGSGSTTMTTTTTTTKTTTATTSSPSTFPACTSPVGVWGQCGGQTNGVSWTTCCVAGSYCSKSNDYYSQCIPGSSSSTSSTSLTSRNSDTTISATVSRITSTTTSRTITTTAAGPSSTCAAAPNTCVAGNGSDNCTPYTVSGLGIRYPSGTTAEASGHVNYQVIACNEYKPGQSYRNRPSSWNARSFGTHFDPYNNQPGGVWIGRDYYNFEAAAAAFPNGYCVIWVQVSLYNQHFGEGGQAPVCSDNCAVTC